MNQLTNYEKPIESKKLSWCKDITICNWEFLLTGDHEITDMNSFKTRCSMDCVNRKMCWALLDLLSRDKADEAVEMLNAFKELNNF